MEGEREERKEGGLESTELWDALNVRYTSSQLPGGGEESGAWEVVEKGDREGEKSKGGFFFGGVLTTQNRQTQQLAETRGEEKEISEKRVEDEEDIT